MDAVALLQAGSSAVVNLAFALLVGALATRYLLRGTAPEGRAVATRIEAWAVAGGILGGAAALWAAAAGMGGVALGEAGEMLGPTLGTSYGRAGLAALAAFAAAGLALLLGRRGGDALLLALLLVFSLARVSASHAAEAGLFSIGALVEWLHLVLVALWVGLVALAGCLVLPRVRAGWPGDAQLGRYLHRVSDWATVALVGIAATGLYNAWHRLGSLDQLFGNLYGNALVLKLALVALAVALGGYNKLFGFPSVPAGRERVIAVLRVELAILAGAMLAAAVLTSTQPPGTFS